MPCACFQVTTLARFLPWGEALVAPDCALEGFIPQPEPPLP